MKGSFSRFAAIAAIVALGVALLSGLFATPVNMRAAIDLYTDRQHLHDLRVVSPLGLTAEDAAAIAAVEGVEEVMPAYFTDMFMDAGETKNIVTRIHSLPTEQIEEREPEGYLNRLDVIEGRLPIRPAECVLVEGNILDGAGALDVGGTVRVSASNGDVEDTLADTEYKIVGIVRASYYCSVDRESASIGNGTVALKMYVGEESFSQDAFSEIFVSVEGARALDAASQEYQDAVDAVSDRIEEISAARCLARYNEVREDAREKLDDARTELAEAEAEADEKLDDAARQLDDARAELDDAKAQLDDAKEQIDDGEAELERNQQTLPGTLTQQAQQLAEGKAALVEAEAQIAENEALLDDSRAQLAAARAQLDAAKELVAQLEPAVAEAGARVEELRESAAEAREFYDETVAAVGLEEKRAAYEQAQAAADAAASEEASAQAEYDAAAADEASAQAEYDAAEQRVTEIDAVADPVGYAEAVAARDSALAALTDAAAQTARASAALSAAQRQNELEQTRLSAARAEYTAAQSAVSSAQSALDTANSRLAAAEAAYNLANTQLAEAKRQIAEGEPQIAEGERQLAEGERRLADAKKQVLEAEKQIAAGEMSLSLAPDLARLQMELARAQLDSAQTQYEDGLAQYEDGEAEWEKGEAEFREQREDARRKLADARQEIADAERALEELEVPEWYRFDRGDVVSVSSFLSNIDKLEAITTVFPVFFFLVAALVALTTMTRMVEEERLQIGTLKALGYKRGQIMFKYLLYAWVATLAGGALGAAFGFTALPLVIWNAYGTMYTIPDFPMPFHAGICAAAVGASLVCTGLATLNACGQTLREWAAQLLLPKAPKAGKRIFLERITPVWRRMKFTHKVTARNLFRYKKRFFMTVVGVAGCTALLVTGFGLQDSIGDIVSKQYGEIFTYDFMLTLSRDSALEDAAFLARMDDASYVREWMAVRQERTEPEFDGVRIGAYLFVPEDASRLPRFIDLHERRSGRPVRLTEDGVIVTEKLAEQAGLAVGDSVTLDNADGKTGTFTVAGIAENYVESFVYLTPDQYAAAYGEAPRPNSVLGNLAEGAAGEDEAFTAALLDVAGVAGLTWSAAMRGALDDTIASINNVVYVIILFAGLLAFVVLYNLMNINITERTKEIATIKVLGFYDREVSAYVSRESNVLAVVGMGVGLVLGVFLHMFIMRTVEVDMVMFGRNIKPLSFVLSAVLTVLFSMLVDLWMRRKLRGISMVESMKAPE